MDLKTVQGGRSGRKDTVLTHLKGIGGKKWKGGRKEAGWGDRGHFIRQERGVDEARSGTS